MNQSRTGATGGHLWWRLHNAREFLEL